MATQSKKTVNLDLLADIAGHVTVFGEEHVVEQLDGAAYRALYNLEAEGSSDIRPLYEAVARVVPTLTTEQVDRLKAKQVGAILAIAGHTVEEVESQFPNADGPATSSPTSPA
jgi:hypothetical protein